MTESEREELKLVEDVLRAEQVRALCRDALRVIPESMPVGEVVDAFRAAEIGCVVVVSDADYNARFADFLEVDVSSAGSPDLGSPGRRAVIAEGTVKGDESVVLKPIGIFTERDVLVKLAGLDADAWLNVKYNSIAQHMVSDPHTIEDTTSLEAATRLLTSRGYRNLPVVDLEGSVTGVLSVFQIIEYFAEVFSADVYNLPTREQADLYDTREGG